LSRHASVHAAGVVITSGRIDDVVPLYKTAKDEIVTQWDMHGVERLGLLKMDFLGLKTVTVVDDTLRSLRHQGIELDLDAVPLDDPETFRIFAEGRTSGIFQFESSGMRDMLRRAQPARFEDLAAFNALYRPGALSVGMVDEYISRKLGRKKVVYILPETEPILRETYGVVAYQEQVMQLAVAIAGFSMAEADVLRKAMGKKNAEAMAKQKEKFLSGAVNKGFARKKAEELWNFIEPFAGYGFNKSHSVAYAMLAYKTAYLKAHYPVAFMAAMLSSEISSTDDLVKYVAECREMKIPVLPPDVNVSEWAFAVEGGSIRFGLGGVKGLGEGAAEAILAARRRVGRFGGMAHLVAEVDSRAANLKVFESLVKSGSCDAFDASRAALVESIGRTLDWAQRRRRAEEAGQGSLFGGASSVEHGPAEDRSIPEWPTPDRLRFEKEALGFFLSGHPLAAFEETLNRLASHDTQALRDGYTGEATVGGIVTRVKRMKIKSGPNAGKVMSRFVLEDLRGGVNVAVFAEAMKRFDAQLVEDAAVIVGGTVRERGGEVELTLERLTPLERASTRLISEVRIVLPEMTSKGTLLRLRDLLAEHPGEAGVVFAMAVDAGSPIEIVPSQRFRVDYSADLEAQIERLVGPGSVARVGL
jgi:DNA polymerase-3 subunit alpha